MFASKDIFLTPPSGGYNISRSVRLRSSASAYFNRTPASSGNRQIMTFSFWMKRGLLTYSSNYLMLFNAYPATSSVDMIGFSPSSDSLRVWFNGSASADLITTQVFRDPSAWYHVVVAIDTTQATAANRIKVYVNGTQITSFSTATYPTQNYNTFWNSSSYASAIGANLNGPQSFFDGYLTEINFIDGQALTPSSFGSTNALTGVWQPAKYTGTYGTNGFYLNFSDNSNNTATTIGKDYSGNGNNWTPNNISVTAGATYDSMTDVPTLTSATAANYATWNALTKNSTLGSANLKSTGGGSAVFYNTAATIGMSTGKWYWEVTCTSNTDGLTGIVDASQVYGLMGTASGSIYVGSTSLGYSYHANGKKYNNATSATYGATYTTGDVIGVAFDADAGTLVFYKNNSSQGTAYTVSAGTWFPADTVYSSDNKDVNFGQRPFSYTPPTGYVALNTFNLPDSTIKNGAAYMAATTWTGTGATLAISNAVNGVSFQPDLVWQKSRSNAYAHKWYDSVRGSTKQIGSDSTAAESTTNSTFLTSFDSGGFTVGSDTGMNGSGSTFVVWNWKAGNSSSSNTNGSITSTVSVGATQGFSVVTYTGNGSTGTVGHGLGVAPNMIITKERSASGNSWPVWFSGVTSGTQYLYLNGTNAVQTSVNYWNSTVPTSSVFSVGNDSATNGTGTHVAYCFAAVKGFSAFGSYTGNGSTDGPFVYTGFRPRWVMIKRSDSTSDWTVWDTSRNTYNQMNLALYPDLSNAETTTSIVIDTVSNGIKIRNSNADTNASGGTYVYACFAENPFKNSLAR